MNQNSTSLQAYTAKLEQKEYTLKQIVQLVFAKKRKKKDNAILVLIENDEATFEHSVFDDDSEDLHEITEEDKQQKMNMLNAAVSLEMIIKILFKILSIYQEIRDDLKALWLDSDDSRIISELSQSNEDICNMNHRIYSNDASF